MVFPHRRNDHYPEIQAVCSCRQEDRTLALGDIDDANRACQLYSHICLHLWRQR
jgi:hypothetical protein